MLADAAPTPCAPLYNRQPPSLPNPSLDTSKEQLIYGQAHRDDYQHHRQNQAHIVQVTAVLSNWPRPSPANRSSPAMREGQADDSLGMGEVGIVTEPLLNPPPQGAETKSLPPAGEG